MLALHNFHETPPNMWKYLVPETNKWVPDQAVLGSATVTAYGDLVDMVRAHYKANAIAVPADVERKIQDQCCRSIPSRFCRDEKGREVPGSRESIFDIKTVIQGTLTLGAWLLKGADRVPQSEIERRTSICGICSFNQEPAGCLGCNAGTLRNAINKVVGGGTLPGDAILKSCLVCGCSLKAKTRIPNEIILDYMSEEQRLMLPAHCWLK